jgi:hypothetical protein
MHQVYGRAGSFVRRALLFPCTGNAPVGHHYTVIHAGGHILGRVGGALQPGYENGFGIIHCQYDYFSAAGSPAGASLEDVVTGVLIPAR